MAVVSSCREAYGSVLQRTKPLHYVASKAVLCRPEWIIQDNWVEKGSMSGRNGPYGGGLVMSYSADDSGKLWGNSEQHPKPRHGSDRGLKPTHVKEELGVIAHQHGAVN